MEILLLTQIFKDANFLHKKQNKIKPRTLEFNFNINSIRTGHIQLLKYRFLTLITN